MPSRPAIDVIAWINAVIRNPEAGKPFELLPAEIAFLEHAFTLDEEGRAVYPELVYSAPKKSGKTGFAAILTLVATLLYGGRDPEAICAANDLEQSSSRVFSGIKKIIRASPALRDRAHHQYRDHLPRLGCDHHCHRLRRGGSGRRQSRHYSR
jgi:phage terminase large subunit-like protein